MKGRRSAVAVMAAMVLAVSGCAQPEVETPTTASPEAEASPVVSPLSNGESAEIHGTEDVSGMTEIDLEMDDYYFGPTILSGKAGQSVTLKLHNEGNELHNFTLSDQAINVDVAVGQTGEAKVTFPASGSLVFSCVYHAVQNMRGQLSTS
jgi:plastocyanin